MSSAPTSRTPFSSSTKSSPPSCATSWSPTTSPISISRRDWTISMPFASGSKRSPAASPVSRRSGSTSTSTFRCSSASPFQSPSARSAIPGSRSTTPLADSTYRLDQLRYDLRKLKAHGLLQRDGSCYAYRLTPKGVHVALLFLFFHKRLCGPLANSRFHHRPDTHHKPASKLEAAYHRADKALQQIVDLLAASPLRGNC